jgi:hypothetical protein
MTQYAFPSSHSPYSAQQPIVYSPSSHSHSQHGHGGYSYGTPLRRTTSGHTYTSSPQYGYPAPVQAPQTVQYLSVPSTHHRSSSHSRHSHSRPRANSHSHHGYGTTATYPVTYATSAPVYIVSSKIVRCLSLIANDVLLFLATCLRTSSLSFNVAQTPFAVAPFPFLYKQW